ncbi:MAG: hypothetical protein ACTSRW_07050 [Candidatus Helarchaeota archaeon]
MRKSYLIITILLLIWASSSFLLITVKALNENSEFVVLFDETHDQYFCYSNGTYFSALSLLNDTGDFEVRILEKSSSITTQTLQTVDILVISNPSSDPTYAFTQEELSAIRSFVQGGGSLFLICSAWANIQYLNVNRPNPTELNKILNSLSLGSTHAFTNETIINFGGSSQYVDDSHQIIISSSEFTLPILGSSNFRVGAGIQQVLIFSSAIQVTDQTKIIARGHAYSKTESSGEIAPPWLVGIEYSPFSRIVLCGAGFMFSDNTRFYSPISSSNPWLYAQDSYHAVSFENLKLWYNIFTYLGADQENYSLLLFLFFIPFFLVGLGIILKDRIKGISLTTGKKPPEKRIEDLLLKRAMILRKARMELKTRNKKEASNLYQRAADLSLKIEDQEAREKYLQKAEDLKGQK